jgi:hypothetical protein
VSLDVYLNSDVCPTCGRGEQVYTANVTHNLGAMASEAGIYKHLWRPEEVGVTHAWQLIEPLRTAIAMLRDDPARFSAFNPANGWGSYDTFVPWLESLLEACESNPQAVFSIWR